MKAFVVVSYASWVASDFEPFMDSTEWKLIRDYGFDIPDSLDDYSSVAWWMNAQHAARLQRAGIANGLIAPGPNWLPGIPESLTGRRIYSAGIADFLSLPSGYQCWVKPSEAKIDGFEAGWRTVAETSNIVASLRIPVDSSVQWTESLLKINHEHRFYVIDGEILTGSAYLVDGVTYYDGAVSSRTSEAHEFANHAVSELGENQPAAYTLDVGFDEINKKWILIEGNPAWCSGIYGSEPILALKAIERSCQGVLSNKDDGFIWVPDAYLKMVAERKILLK